MKRKKLFLIDAYAIIFRGYYAFIKSPMINSKGLNTSAIYGFMNTLLEIIKKENPEYLAVAFDKDGSKERKNILESYKSNRQPTPEPIVFAVPYIHDILNKMKIPILEKSGYEADDIIGTIAHKAERENFDVYMVTPDKDFAQLVTQHIFIYKPARSGNGIEIMGVEEVKAKFEIEDPKQVIDYLGMMGDAVDNIPGLPGVGDKTAKKFLGQFKNMENLLNNTDSIKGKLKEKIENNKELGLLSKKLATIDLNVPIDFDKDKYELSHPDMEEANKIFSFLEFNRLKNNFNKMFHVEQSLFNQNDYQDKREQNLEEKNTFYQYLIGRTLKKTFTKILLKQKKVCFDIEREKGISFSWNTGKGYYWPFPNDKKELEKDIGLLKPFFEDKTIFKIGQNIKHHIKVLKKYSIDVEGVYFDTILADYIIDPDRKHTIDNMALRYLNYERIPIETLIGEKQKSIDELEIDKITQYTVESADLTYQLYLKLKEKLEKEKLTKLFNELELPLIDVLKNMEMEGIAIDKLFLEKLSIKMQNELDIQEQKIYELAGEEFNISSPKQIGTILFEKLKLVEKPKKTKTGQYATSEEILKKLADKHQIIKEILNHRELSKLLSTYINALPKQVNPNTNRIHTIYNQALAATGRLSSNEPNLQNIPIRTERGKLLRKAFISKDKSHKLLSADYSQIELRVIASVSKEKNMIDAFIKNKDIHRDTASNVFKINYDAVSKTQRSHAKTVNFGIIYGVSAFGLSQQTSLNRKESKELIDSYFANYPGLKKYMDIQIELAREQGYVETLLGRRRYIPNIHSSNFNLKSAAERNAINSPIQGTAADIIKTAMINVDKKIKKEKLKSKMLLQVHDELLFEFPIQEEKQLREIVKYEMEHVMKLEVPLLVEMAVGDNWLEAH